ncbi:MAG: PucR family transcriptional regulator, partial [Lachnospiraceae bacterium]|nr:PucR family transcriptional regulator [Lachnospiraceae bacterium]
MISNQILQSTLDGLKTIARVEFGIFDPEGKTVASTREFESGELQVAAFAASQADSQEIQGLQYFKIFDDQQLEYVLAVAGPGEDVYTIGKMAAYQIQGLMVAYKERFDKDNFVKNLLLDNLLLVDIYGRSKKLHIKNDAFRVVMVIESAGAKDNNVLELTRTWFGTAGKDFITTVDEKSVVVVKEISAADAISEVERTAGTLLAFLEKEGATEVRIAYGTVVAEIKEVSRSYKEARMAADVGRIFFEERRVIAYSELGIGRLIYQLPIPLCKMFIKEIFDGSGPEDFDDDTLPT